MEYLVSEHSHKLSHFLDEEHIIPTTPSGAQLLAAHDDSANTRATEKGHELQHTNSRQKLSSQSHAIFSHPDGELLHSAFTLLAHLYFCFSPSSPSKYLHPSKPWQKRLCRAKKPPLLSLRSLQKQPHASFLSTTTITTV